MTVDVVAAAVDLVRPVAEHLVELLHRDGDRVGVGDPGAVEAVAGLAALVLAHASRSPLRWPPGPCGWG